jgi:hypothetical protein
MRRLGRFLPANQNEDEETRGNRQDAAKKH